MSHILFDIRDAARGLLRDRVYAGTVLATLALTLGVSTAVFSIVNGVLLRPLSYPESDRLVSIREVLRDISARYPTLSVNGRHFEEWRNQATSFEAMAELDFRLSNLTGLGDPVQLPVLRARGPVLGVLGVPIAQGRALMPEDEEPGRPAVAVISHRLWQDRFRGDAAILGRILTLGGSPYTVVGVLPSELKLPEFDALSGAGSLTGRVDAIVPLRPNFQNIGWNGQFNYAVIARLREGVTLDRARAELDVLQESVAVIARRETHEPATLAANIQPLDESITGRARVGLLVLLAAIGAVVLIACSNIANLSLARAVGRTRDAAVRTALGAGRGRLVGRIVLEQLLLAGAGAALGVIGARQAVRAFVLTAPLDIPRAADVRIDARVIAFAGALAVAVGLATALLPAWRIAGGDVQGALRGGGHGATDRGGQRIRSSLLGLQVALAVMLLMVTTVLVSSFIRLMRVDPGFSPDGVVAVQISPLASRYPDTDERTALYDRILERVHALPAVSSASWTSLLPLSGETWVDAISRDGNPSPGAQKPSANYRFVGPEYFRTLSMPLLKGRSITDSDRNAARVPAVISQRTASTIWPNEDPIGRTFRRADPSQLKPFEVVGVVADGRATALDRQSPLMVYVPYWFNNEGKSVLLVHVAGEAVAAVSAVRSVVRDVDPEIAIADAVPLTSVVASATEGRRYQVQLFVAFGLIALGIASLGVYATTAYGVSRRRREMNIRVALGARRAQVLRLVITQSAIPIGAGLVAGCLGAAAMKAVLAALVFEGRPLDPRILTAVAILVGVVGLSACITAARHGLRLDPVAALREQ